MAEKEFITESQLAALAKTFRKATGKNQAEAAREFKVSRASILYAENEPSKSLFNLRKRMIEKYSSHKLVGPVYWLEKK